MSCDDDDDNDDDDISGHATFYRPNSRSFSVPCSHQRTPRHSIRMSYCRSNDRCTAPGNCCGSL